MVKTKINQKAEVHCWTSALFYVERKTFTGQQYIFLDSGSRYNKVNAALLPDAPRETMDLPQGDISRRLEVQQMPACRDVETLVGDRTTRLNFVLTDRPDAVLNFDFLRNTVFVLDYDRREIRIKQ